MRPVNGNSNLKAVCLVFGLAILLREMGTSMGKAFFTPQLGGITIFISHTPRSHSRMLSKRPLMLPHMCCLLAYMFIFAGLTFR